jgi:hypothetical protein
MPAHASCRCFLSIEKVLGISYNMPKNKGEKKVEVVVASLRWEKDFCSASRESVEGWRAHVAAFVAP